MSPLTKKMISDMFVELLQNNSIENINIKRLSEKCSLNRNTFYYHFSDIYSLMAWCLNERISEFRKDAKPTNGLLKNEINLIISFFKQEKKCILNAYDPTNHIYYEIFLQRQLQPILSQRIRNYKNSKSLNNDTVEFISSAYAKIGVGILLDWISCGMPSYEEHSLSKISLLIDERVLERAVDRFVNQEN